MSLILINKNYNFFFLFFFAVRNFFSLKYIGHFNCLPRSFVKFCLFRYKLSLFLLFIIECREEQQQQYFIQNYNWKLKCWFSDAEMLIWFSWHFRVPFVICIDLKNFTLVIISPIIQNMFQDYLSHHWYSHDFFLRPSGKCMTQNFFLNCLKKRQNLSSPTFFFVRNITLLYNFQRK